MISKWKKIKQVSEEDYIIFKAVKELKLHPNWNKESTFVKLKSRDWVNIIPVTKEGNIILIKQYRHGIDDFTIEIPGGIVDSGESSSTAGVRECLEETGYSSKETPIKVGETSPNPAILNNSHFCYLLENCEFQGKGNSDEHEEIDAFEASYDEVQRFIDDGKIKHSLVLAAFYFYERYLNKKHDK